jgi:hypothetical protein
MKEKVDKPEVLLTGDTFYLCTTDIKDAVDKQKFLQARAQAHANKQKMIEMNRMLQKKAIEEAAATKLAQRAGERILAKDEKLKAWSTAYDEMHTKDLAARAKQKTEQYRIIEMSKAWDNTSKGWTGTTALVKANKSSLISCDNLVMHIKSSALSGNSLGTYLDRMLKSLSTLGFKGVVSIVCYDWQQNQVYTSLLKSMFIQFDPIPYIIGHTRTAFTLEDKGVFESGWGMNAELSANTKKEFGHGHPEAQIISAKAEGTPEFKDHKSWNGGAAEFLRQFGENNPQNRTFHADKFHFSVNTSKDWTSGYPWAHAFANFLYWRTLPTTTVGFITDASDFEENMFPVVNAVMRRKTVVICAPAKKPTIDKALKTAYYISDPQNSACWAGYAKDLTFLIHVEFALGASTHASLDAFQLLMSQTALPDDRYLRGNDFYCKAWKSLKILPKKVKIPLKPGKHMLGCIAETAIKEGETIVRGTGFFWHKAYPLPTASQRGYDQFQVSVPQIWGVEMDIHDGKPEDNVPENLLFVLNASSIMSCINDSRGIAAKQNADLVQEFYLDDEKKTRPCLSIAVVASRDIKQGDQVLVNYGKKFWDAKENADEMEDEDYEVILFCFFLFVIYLSRFKPHVCNVGA